MNKDRLFLDTVFIQAILNQNDQYHQRALSLLLRVKKAREIWLTEAILMQVGNALSGFNRQKVVDFIRQCYRTDNIRVVNITTDLFEQGLSLYESRLDKSWGLVDCLSFIVMQQQGLMEAVIAVLILVRYTCHSRASGNLEKPLFPVPHSSGKRYTSDQHFIQAGFRALLLED